MDAALIRDVGFDPMTLALRIARYIEPFLLLVAQLAYQGKSKVGTGLGSRGLGNSMTK